MIRMNSIKSWKGWILYSVLFVPGISLVKDTPFPICLPEHGEEDKTCYTPSIHSMGWSFCIKECKIYHAELTTTVDSRIYFDLLLKLLSHGGVYWIAASRNNTEWRWTNDVSLPPQLLKNLGVENSGNCLSLDVQIPSKSLQPRECNGNYTCLCQYNEKGSMNSQTTRKETTAAVTTVSSVVTSVRSSSLSPFLQSVHTFIPAKTSTVASQATTQQSKATAATVSSSATFCKSTMSRDMCYYYYDVLCNQYEAAAFCHALGMNVFHFDNDNATAQFVREKLRNILGGIWLGAIKISNGWNWIDGPKFTDVLTNKIISTDGDQGNENCLILVTSIQSFSSVNCQKNFSVLCQDSSGIHITTSNASRRIASTTATVSTAHTLETDTFPMETSLRLGFSISNTNNESNITKTRSTILTATKASSFTPSTRPKPNVSNAATAVARTTTKPSTVNHDGFNFSTLLMKSFQAPYTTKTSTTISSATRKQFNETVRYNVSFCISESSGDVCYYYYEDCRNQYEAAALCHGFGKEIFHFDNNNATAQSVREQLRNISDGVWLGASKLSNGWIWVDGQHFTDFWTKNLVSTDPHSENKSCLIFVPSLPSLARMGCQETYSVLCQDSNGTSVRRPLFPSNESASVPVTTYHTVDTSVLPVETSSRKGISMFNPNNVSDFASTLSFNLTYTEATTRMTLTQFKSKVPTTSSPSTSKTTTTPTKGSESSTVSGKYSSMEKALIQTSPDVAISTTNMSTMTLGSMTFPSVSTELSTTVPNHIILQSVSTEQSNTANRSNILENVTTAVLNGKTTLNPVTLKGPETPNVNTSGGKVPLSTQRTNSHVQSTVSLPASSLRTPLYGGTTQSIPSPSLVHLSTKEGYNGSSTEPDRRFKSEHTTLFSRQSVTMSNVVPTSKHGANTESLPSNKMDQTSQLPSGSFSSIMRGNKSYVQDITATTSSFTSGSKTDRTLPVNASSSSDSTTTTYRLGMSKRNIGVRSQQDTTKVIIIGASVGVGFLLLVILITVVLRKRMGSRRESKKEITDQPSNVYQLHGTNADGYIAEFNERFVENPLYGQSEL